MEENTINDYLLTGLRAYVALKEKGWEKESDFVLRLTYRLAEKLVKEDVKEKKFYEIYS